MSLDVYLIMKEPQIKKPSSGIFIRENGQTKEITQEEWNAKNPDREPVKFKQEETETNEVYSANITHNLNTMADEAGIYKHLWRPDEIKITKALIKEPYNTYILTFGIPLNMVWDLDRLEYITELLKTTTTG